MGARAARALAKGALDTNNLDAQPQYYGFVSNVSGLAESDWEVKLEVVDATWMDSVWATLVKTGVGQELQKELDGKDFADVWPKLGDDLRMKLYCVYLWFLRTVLDVEGEAFGSAPVGFFGFTQVTTVLSNDPTWQGLEHGLLIFVALWWAWAAYAWLTNSIDPDEEAVWGSLLVAIAAMFIAALAVPEAFGRQAVRRLDQGQGAALWKCPFGHDHNAELRAPLVALAQPLRDQIDVERNFRNQNRIRPAGDACPQRDPARIPSHHFDHENPAVRFGGRVQPIDGIGRKRHRGVEAEAVDRADDVVVDRLWHADKGDAGLAEVVRDTEGAVAADDHERIESHPVEYLDDPLRIDARAFRSGDEPGGRIAGVDRA